MSWIVTYAIISTFVMLMVVIAEPKLRPEWREAILWVGLISPVLLATVAALSPYDVSGPGIPNLAPSISVALPADVPVSAESKLSIPIIVFSIWAAGALLLLVYDVIRRARLLRALDRKRCDTVDPVSLATTLGFYRRVIITESETLPVPIALGSREICLPSNIQLSVSRDNLDSILGHEIAHLRRRDPRLHQLAGLVSRVFWWQPLTLVIAKRLAAVAELRADELCTNVIAPTQLAEALVNFAGHSRAIHFSGLPAFPAGLLNDRISRLLQDRAPTSGIGIRLVVCCLFTLAALIISPRFSILRGELPPILPPLIVVASQVSPLGAAHDATPASIRAPTRVVATKEPGQEDVVAALERLLHDKEPQVRSAARESLASIGTPASKSALATDSFLRADSKKELR